jgi:tRNA pseudouridine65 synthase
VAAARSLAATPLRTALSRRRHHDKPQPTVAARLLWRDTSLGCVLDKPAHLLVHNSRFAGRPEPTLVAAGHSLTGQRVMPVHRLDRATSGVVLCAWDAPGVAAWQPLLADTATEKDYVAVVKGWLSAASCVIRPVRDDRGERREARTEVWPVARSAVAPCSLVHLRLHTGRLHQARRHLRTIRHPVLGDASHGRAPWNRSFRRLYGLERLALHAYRLRVARPDGGWLEVTAPPPDDLRDTLGQLFGEQALVDAFSAAAGSLWAGPSATRRSENRAGARARSA